MVQANKLLLLAAALALALICLGGNCPGTGSSANFSASSGAATGEAKQWRAAALIDPNSIDGNSFNHNILDTAPTASAYPMSVFAEGAKSFFVIFNRETSGSDVGIFGTFPSNFSGNAWASTMGGFSQFDSSVTDPTATRPITAVDARGNSVTAYMEFPAAGNRAMKAVRRAAGAAAWVSAVDLRASAEVAAAVNVFPSSSALATDAFNAFIAAWCSADNALYFNQFISGVGWRFNNSSTANATWNDTADCQDLGVDVAFDGYGNGYGAYVTTGDDVKVRRWQGDTPANWLAAGHKDIANGSSACYPRLFLTPGGAGSLFFYKNCSGAAGDLFVSSAAATSLSSPPASSDFGAATQFDVTGGAGTSYVQDNTDPIFPMLSHAGSFAAIGFIKADSSGTRRLWVSIFDGSGWGALNAVDAASGDVTWGDVAVNAGGDIAVAYSADDGGAENIYLNNYSGGAWKTAVKASLPVILSPGVGATARYHPSVAIDSGGNAIAVFSMNDIGGKRRAVAVIYK